MSATDAEAHDFDSQRLERLERAVQNDIAAEAYDGAALHIARGGETVLSGTYGFSDRASQAPLTPQNLFYSYSCAKQLTVAVVLSYVERGLLSLTAPVADVIPEFGCRGKERITLTHLLTHRAGLPLLLPPMPPEEMGNLEAVVAATCALAPESPPGERVAYAALVGHAIMAEMVRRADGGNRRYRDILHQELFEPLGMNDCALGKPDAFADRVCPAVVRDRSQGLFDPEAVEGIAQAVTAEAEIPGGGCIVGSDGLFRFADMLRRGGERDGKRILSPGMIDLITRNHTGSRPNDLWAFTEGMRGWEPWPANLGLGFFLRGEGLHPAHFGTLASPRTFGGMGAGGTMFWIDPARDITFVYLTTGLLEESRNIDRCQRISDMVLSADMRAP